MKAVGRAWWFSLLLTIRQALRQGSAGIGKDRVEGVTFVGAATARRAGGCRVFLSSAAYATP